MKNISALIFLFVGLIGCNQKENQNRISLSLNGQWQIAQTIEDAIPENFSGNVPVPGLVDMATPAFDSVGVKTDLRNYFWYKTTFSANTDRHKLAFLKFHKTKYGLKAWLNGNEIGENMLNFTPAKFQVTDHLKSGENELVVRVFATPDMLPDSIVWGHDFEKLKYIPGIYDDVELILNNQPFIINTTSS